MNTSKRSLIKGLFGICVSIFVIVSFIFQAQDCLNRYDEKIIPAFLFFYVIFILIGIAALLKSIYILFKYIIRK